MTIEAIAVWLEKDCDEQYLADRVRAGDWDKEKGRTGFQPCALTSEGSEHHLSPISARNGESNSKSE